MATSFTFKPIVLDGLVMYLDASNKKSYPGSGDTWYDLTSNSNNATLFNSPAFDTEVGGNILFDGVNDYGIINYNTDNIPYGTQSLSIDVWFKPTRGYFAGEEIFGMGSNGSSGNRVALYIYDYIYIETINSAISTNELMTFDKWINFSATIPFGPVYTSDIKMYINGKLIEVPFIYNDQPINIDPVEITLACIPQSGQQGIFMGNISSVMIYNRSLSGSEVLQNYNALKNKYI